MRPRHVLYFIQFLLRTIAFCVSGELVVFITPCRLSAFTAMDYGAFQTSALEMKNEGVDKSFMTTDVPSLKCQ